MDAVLESIVLAGLVKNRDKLFELDGKFLQHTDFYYPEHQKLYELIKHVIVKIEPVVIDEYVCLAAANELGLGLSKNDKSALEAVLARNVGVETLISSAKQIKRASVTRFLQSYLERESNDIEKATGTVTEIIGGLESRLFSALSSLGSQEEDTINLAAKAFDYVKKLIGSEPIGLDLGFTRWQKAAGKIRNGSVHGIFARMKQGKSQLALQMAVRAMLKNVPVLLLDTELGEELQMIRLCAQAAKVPYEYIEDGTWVRNNDMVKRMAEAEEWVKTKELVYADISGLSVDEAVNHIRKFALKYNKNPVITPQCLVIYDYVKLPDIGMLATANEYQILGAVTSKLHDEALRLRLPIILVGQQNRSGAEQDGTTTIADSDKIARDIDSISIIRRKTEREIANDPIENGSHILKVIACRSGPGHIGDEYTNLHFDMSCGFIIEGEDFTYEKLQWLRNQVERNEP
jgi:replicative DNA helicase